MTQITIPAELLPGDGRFGSGPSKVRSDAVQRLAASAPALLGTSHRRPAVKELVRRIREGLFEFFALPDDYEVALGNGGATLFWDVAAYSLIRARSAHAVFGEFSAKFAAEVRALPFLDDPVVVDAPPGQYPRVALVPGVDAYALTHCETSTGVVMPLERHLREVLAAEDLVLVDATSAAGGVAFDPRTADAYYFSPQKCFGSDGGLWLALLSPRALARADEVTGARHVPAMLDLRVAIDNARQNQTYNTPAVATLFLLVDQIEWMNAQGGLSWAAKDCATKAQVIYEWAEDVDYATPFVQDTTARSPVVCTIDLDPGVPADGVTGALRAHGVLDTEAYRKLGRNQLRIATFPAIERRDVEQLVAAIDFVARALRA